MNEQEHKAFIAGRAPWVESAKANHALAESVPPHGQGACVPIADFDAAQAELRTLREVRAAQDERVRELEADRKEDSDTLVTVAERWKGLWAEAQIVEGRPWFWMQIQPATVLRLIEELSRAEAERDALRASNARMREALNVAREYVVDAYQDADANGEGEVSKRALEQIDAALAQPEQEKR